MSGLSTGVAAFAVLLCGIATLSLLRTRRATTVGSIAGQWPHTRGTVLSATVQVSHAHDPRHEAPIVLYAYQVNGQMFQGHRVRAAGAGLAAADTVARYPAGSSVIVYYDPTDPSKSALER